MKKTILILIVFITVNVSAQNTAIITDNKNYSALLKLHPINLIVSEFQLGFEPAISRRNSFNINVGLTAAGNSNIYYGDNILGFRLEGQFRRYLSGGNILKGFYAGPYAFYRNISLDRVQTNYDPITGLVTEEMKRGTAKTYGGGVMLGFQTIISNVFSLDFYVGSGVKFSTDDIEENNNNGWWDPSDGTVWGFRNTGIAPYGGINFGITL